MRLRQQTVSIKSEKITFPLTKRTKTSKVEGQDRSCSEKGSTSAEETAEERCDS